MGFKGRKASRGYRAVAVVIICIQHGCLSKFPAGATFLKQTIS